MRRKVDSPLPHRFCSSNMQRETNVSGPAVTQGACICREPAHILIVRSEAFGISSWLERRLHSRGPLLSSEFADYEEFAKGRGLAVVTKTKWGRVLTLLLGQAAVVRMPDGRLERVRLLPATDVVRAGSEDEDEQAELAPPSIRTARRVRDAANE